MHHMSYYLVLLYFNELRKHVNIYFFNLIVFLYQWFYDTLYVMLSFQIMVLYMYIYSI